MWSSAMPIPTQSELSEETLPASLFAVRPADLKNDSYPNGRSSVGKRAFISILIIFCIGVSATLAWQWYGAGEIIASPSPQLSGLPPQAEPVPRNAPEVIGLDSRTASSPDQQEPSASLDLGLVRQSINQIAASIASSQGRTDRMATTQDQIARSLDRMATAQEQMARSVDRIATSQEQLTRSVDQLRADQEQMTHEITKLQEIGQSIRSKNSEPRPTSAPAPKPILQPTSASAPKPVSRPASAPKPASPTLPEPTGP
jgi:hypothetical protein